MSLLFLCFFSSVLVFLCNSFFMLWFFMEMNSLFFILKLLFDKEFKGAIMYFILGSFLSVVFIYFVLSFLDMGSIACDSSSGVLFLVALFSLGVMPVHFWLKKVSLSLSFHNLKILFSIQKLPPLKIVDLILVEDLSVFYLAVLLYNFFSSSFKISMVVSLNLFMFFYSVNSLSWLILIMWVNSVVFFVYFLFSSLSLWFLLEEWSSLSVFSLSSLFDLNVLLLMWNLLGLPPSSMFFCSMMILQELLESGMNLLIVLFFSFFSIFLTKKLLDNFFFKMFFLGFSMSYLFFFFFFFFFFF